LTFFHSRLRIASSRETQDRNAGLFRHIMYHGIEGQSNYKFLIDFGVPTMTEKPSKRVHVLVSGRVQGVFFRANTRAEAKRLGLKGWVKNLPGGRVELVAEGPSRAVKELISWCYKGPAYSKVDKVEFHEETPTGKFDEFSIRF
jgi:acylphosphatase